MSRAARRGGARANGAAAVSAKLRGGASLIDQTLGAFDAARSLTRPNGRSVELDLSGDTLRAEGEAREEAAREMRRLGRGARVHEKGGGFEARLSHLEGADYVKVARAVSRALRSAGVDVRETGYTSIPVTYANDRAAAGGAAAGLAGDVAATLRAAGLPAAGPGRSGWSVREAPGGAVATWRTAPDGGGDRSADVAAALAPRFAVRFDPDASRDVAVFASKRAGAVTLGNAPRRAAAPAEVPPWEMTAEEWRRADVMTGASHDRWRRALTESDADERLLPVLYRDSPHMRASIPRGAAGAASMPIYSAVPKAASEIRPGDWVAVDRAYALEHLEMRYGRKGKVVSRDVAPDEVKFAGTSPEEWFYAPRWLRGTAGDSTHERLVRAALRAGLPVPARVLAEYGLAASAANGAQLDLSGGGAPAPPRPRGLAAPLPSESSMLLALRGAVVDAFGPGAGQRAKVTWNPAKVASALLLPEGVTQPVGGIEVSVSLPGGTVTRRVVVQAGSHGADLLLYNRVGRPSGFKWDLRADAHGVPLDAAPMREAAAALIFTGFRRKA